MMWERLPVDDVGYFTPAIIEHKSDQELREWVEGFERVRYAGWRNRDNRWRALLGLDETVGEFVLDFGCGFGIEALQFARAGCDVSVADINQASVDAAVRVLEVFGYTVPGAYLVSPEPPFMTWPLIDIFYANGVLHHTRYFREVLEGVFELNPDCEARLMLYSDRAWEIKVGTDAPPIDYRPFSGGDYDHNYHRFVRAMDGTGNYADWFTREKVEYLVGDFLKVVLFERIARDDIYSVAILRHR